MIKICLRGKIVKSRLKRKTWKNLATLKKYLATLKRVATPSLRTAGLQDKCSITQNKNYKTAKF